MTPDEIDGFIAENIECLLGRQPLIMPSTVIYCIDGRYEVQDETAARAHFALISSGFASLGVTELRGELKSARIKADRECQLEIMYHHRGGKSAPSYSHASYFLRRKDGAWQLELVEIHSCPVLTLVRAQVAAETLH